MATTINDIENSLWDAADKLHANTHLRSSEYSIPVLVLIFLKFADQKFADTLKALLAIFDGIPLDIEGDVFGRTYEYFL